MLEIARYEDIVILELNTEYRQLRARRALLPLTLYSNSALLVLNRTSLSCNNALLALNWRHGSEINDRLKVDYFRKNRHVQKNSYKCVFTKYSRYDYEEFCSKAAYLHFCQFEIFAIEDAEQNSMKFGDTNDHNFKNIPLSLS